jgi:hypothetical protein
MSTLFTTRIFAAAAALCTTVLLLGSVLMLFDIAEPAGVSASQARPAASGRA